MPLSLRYPVLEGVLDEWFWESDWQVDVNFFICGWGFNPGSRTHLASCLVLIGTALVTVLFLIGTLSSQFKGSTCLLNALPPPTVCVCPVAQMNTWIPGMKKINACCIKSVMQVGVSH